MSSPNCWGCKTGLNIFLPGRVQLQLAFGGPSQSTNVCQPTFARNNSSATKHAEHERVFGLQLSNAPQKNLQQSWMAEVSKDSVTKNIVWLERVGVFRNLEEAPACEPLEQPVVAKQRATVEASSPRAIKSNMEDFGKQSEPPRHTFVPGSISEQARRCPMRRIEEFVDLPSARVRASKARQHPATNYTRALVTMQFATTMPKVEHWSLQAGRPHSDEQRLFCRIRHCLRRRPPFSGGRVGFLPSRAARANSTAAKSSSGPHTKQIRVNIDTRSALGGP